MTLQGSLNGSIYPTSLDVYFDPEPVPIAAFELEHAIQLHGPLRAGDVHGGRLPGLHRGMPTPNGNVSEQASLWAVGGNLSIQFSLKPFTADFGPGSHPVPSELHGNSPDLPLDLRHGNLNFEPGGRTPSMAFRTISSLRFLILL